MSNSNWFVQEGHYTEWSREENKQFEHALAIYDKDTPDRWLRVAAMLPGRSVYDVIKQYRELEEDVSEIEAGRIPIPGYVTSSFSLEMVDNHCYDACRKKPATVRSSDQEKKKGVPWTEEEHRSLASSSFLFLFNVLHWLGKLHQNVVCLTFIHPISNVFIQKTADMSKHIF